MWSVFDLEPLALSLKQLFVICDLFHQPPDLLPKKLVQFGTGCFGVFERVVEQRGLQGRQVRHCGHTREEFSDGDDVVDVRIGVAAFAPLATMLERSKVCGGENLLKVGWIGSRHVKQPRQPAQPIGSARWTRGFAAYLPQQCLNFLPLPQGHGSLRPTFGPVRTGLALACASTALAASLTTSLAFV